MFDLGMRVKNVWFANLRVGLSLKNWLTHSMIVGINSCQNFLKNSDVNIFGPGDLLIILILHKADPNPNPSNNLTKKTS